MQPHEGNSAWYSCFRLTMLRLSNGEKPMVERVFPGTSIFFHLSKYVLHFHRPFVYGTIVGGTMSIDCVCIRAVFVFRVFAAPFTSALAACMSHPFKRMVMCRMCSLR